MTMSRSVMSTGGLDADAARVAILALAVCSQTLQGKRYERRRSGHKLAERAVLHATNVQNRSFCIIRVRFTRGSVNSLAKINEHGMV